MAKIHRVEFGAEDHPLIIGDIEIPCYVLNNGQRVVTQRGLLRALGLSSGSSIRGADRLVSFASGNRLKPYVSSDILLLIENPVRFKLSENPAYGNGYDATVLVGLCEAVIAANDDDVLQQQQQHIVERCKVLMGGWARVGLIALIDETTGFQEVRQRNELRKILEAYVNAEFLPWTKQFPDTYYEQLFRLKNWTYNPASVKRPMLAGRITEDIVYKRLPPGVLDELRRVNPKTPKGYRKRTHHQHLTEDIGHHHLRDHLLSVVTLMRAAPNWTVFKRLLERSIPKPNTQMSFEWPEDAEGLLGEVEAE